MKALIVTLAQWTWLGAYAEEVAFTAVALAVTYASFVLWRLGRLPVAGEKLRWRDLEIEVVDMDGSRIDKLLVTRRRDSPSEPHSA